MFDYSEKKLAEVMGLDYARIKSGRDALKKDEDWRRAKEGIMYSENGLSALLAALGIEIAEPETILARIRHVDVIPKNRALVHSGEGLPALCPLIVSRINPRNNKTVTAVMKGTEGPELRIVVQSTKNYLIGQEILCRRREGFVYEPYFGDPKKRRR